MIYPTRAGVGAAAAGVPFALIVALIVPGAWYAGLAWPGAVLLLTLGDAWIGRRAGTATLALPRVAQVGAPVTASVRVTIAGPRPPAIAEVALSPDPLLAFADGARRRIALAGGRGTAAFTATTLRRGTARIADVWLRWPGPLGLAWAQRRIAADAALPVLPDLRPVHEGGARLFRRHALHGLMTQVDRGDGTEFDMLVDYQPGMDRRAIDWKRSARGRKLAARAYRPERNTQIVFAIDASRQMCEPVGGVPRVDRAVSAMLLAAWVALKLGDRVALTAFDARPRLRSGFVSGLPAFAELQRLAAGIDYAAEEANYALALTTLAGALTRRSMIVLFTEFTDLTSADFLVRAAAELVKTHLLFVVVLRDAELEAILGRPPLTGEDVTRAVTAAALLKDRLIVLTRLRHLGVHVVESAHDAVNDRLVAAYVDAKRRNLL